MMQMVAPLEIGICCADLERQLRFYVDVLGCRVVSILDVPAAKAREAALSPEAYRVARVQTPYGERLKLLRPQRAPQAAQPPAWILERRNTMYLTFIVDDIDATMARLSSAGARLLTGAQRVDVRPGVWLCFACDPEDNLIELVQYDDLDAYRGAASGAAAPGAAS